VSERVSDLGRYEGYTSPVANGYSRMSEYVAVDDGCRLAVDVLRPTLDGDNLRDPLPTIVHATGYRRAYFFGETDLALVGDQPAWKKLKVGDLVTGYEKSELAKRLVDHGYNLVCVDLRGTGASFGETSNQMWRNSADLAQVIDWVAEQDWATDRVGMIGISWEGTIQLTTAAYHPKHTKAIAPMATSQGFSAVCDGGLLLHGFYSVDWAKMVADQRGQAPALPVDGNLDPALMEQALAERVAPAAPEVESDPLAAMKMVRDPMLAAVRMNAPEPPLPGLGPLGDSMDETARINASGTAVLLISGWWDISFSGHALDFFRALSVPKRMLMGPWNHLGPTASYIEQHRWFDYWLKDIDNGIAEEPQFNFAEVDAFGHESWASAPAYPLPESRKTRFDLGSDGKISDQPQNQQSETDYPIDYSVTLGDQSRSRFFFRTDRRIIPPDLDERASKCLTFMTDSFQSPVRLNGRPELYVYLKTSGQSGALIATLEELLEDGRTHYLTEGSVNFFHRRISNSRSPHDGRAFHSQNSCDLMDVKPHEIMEVGLEFYPVGWRLSPGSRIRLTLAGADADNLLVIPEEPAPTLTIMTGGEPASHLVLPVVDPALPASTLPKPDARFVGKNSRAFKYLEPGRV
jgi:putative CocE/NonD family hydrolase